MRTVYIHTTPEGKRYVGATRIDPNKRFKNGLGYRYQFFYQAILKFGWENITHQLYEVDTEEEMHYLEKYLISYYDTTNPDKGYNIAKGDSTQDHGMDHPEYGKSDWYSQYKESCRKYHTSDKGKEALKRHYASGKGKEASKRYRESEKGKESIKQYRASEKNKEAQKKYRTSDKGKETMQRWMSSDKGKESQKKFRESEKGKEYYKKYRMSEKNKLAHQRWYEKKKKQTQNE